MIPAVQGSALRNSPQRLKPGRGAASSQTPHKARGAHVLELGRASPISTDLHWGRSLTRSATRSLRRDRRHSSHVTRRVAIRPRNGRQVRCGGLDGRPQLPVGRVAATDLRPLCSYLNTIGLTGPPTPLRMGSGAADNKKSYRWSDAHAAARASSSNVSPRIIPM